MIAAMLLTLYATNASAAVSCKAVYELRKDVVIERNESVVVERADGPLISGETQLKDCFFSVKGFVQDDEYKLFVVDGDPPLKGAGVASSGSFNGQKQIRLSYVKDFFVCKLECTRE